MRIAVISDTHVPQRPGTLDLALIAELKKADMVIHAGDIAEASFLEKIKAFCPRVIAVAGNMDSDELKRQLPEKQIIKAGSFRIGLMHGWGAPGMLIELLAGVFKSDKVDMIVFGHSHSPVNETRDGVLFFNPGSPTDTVFAPYRSYGIIEVNDTIDARIIKL
jgi:putative phosphoesterase